MMHKQNALQIYSACALASLTLFVLLGAEITAGGVTALDLPVRDYVHWHMSSHLANVMQGLSLLGSVLVVYLGLAISGAFFWWMGWRESARAMAWAMAGAAVLDNGLKFSFHRPRPEPFFGVAPHSYSFPSGHALFSVCFYAALAALVVERVSNVWMRVLVWTVAGGIIALVGLSRIYLGVHYPSDVLGGYLAGAFWLSMLGAARQHRLTRGEGHEPPEVPPSDVTQS